MNRREFWLSAMAWCAASATFAEARQQRIVSTAPSITEALFALGLGAQVVGVSKYCNFPAVVRALPKVGSYVHPDAEAIARLKPDLVFVQRSPSELAARLSGLSLAVIEIPHGTLEDVYRGIALIADTCGVHGRGESLNGRIRERLSAIERKARSKGVVRALVILDRKGGTLSDLTAVGPKNYVDELLSIAGGDNVLKSAAIPYPKIAFETVLRENPEVIIDLSGERNTEEERRSAKEASLALWRHYATLTAVREDRVLIGTSNALLVPGPRSVDAAGLLFDAMHDHRPASAARLVTPYLPMLEGDCVCPPLTANV
jgi:iron complex transport system substrate-binding protein